MVFSPLICQESSTNSVSSLSVHHKESNAVSYFPPCQELSMSLSLLNTNSEPPVADEEEGRKGGTVSRRDKRVQYNDGLAYMVSKLPGEMAGCQALASSTKETTGEDASSSLLKAPVILAQQKCMLPKGHASTVSGYVLGVNVQAGLGMQPQRLRRSAVPCTSCVSCIC